MNVQEHYINSRLSDEEVKLLKGHLLGDKDYNQLIKTDADVYCEQTGQCIAKFRKKIIPVNIAKQAYESLKSVSIASMNRGASAGLKDNGKTIKAINSKKPREPRLKTSSQRTSTRS